MYEHLRYTKQRNMDYTPKIYKVRTKSYYTYGNENEYKNADVKPEWMKSLRKPRNTWG
jgi:hypothetical protein